MKNAVIFAIVCLCAVAGWGKGDKMDSPELRAVRSIFVTGNNVSANYVRKEVSRGKTCLSLAAKEVDADGTLAVDAVQSVGTGAFGPHDTNVQTSATLTLKDGSVVWSEAVGGGVLNTDGKFGGQRIVWKLSKAVCKSQ